MKKYSENDLIRIAKRRNNSKRSFLLVNPLQAKHIAVEPHKAAMLMTSLGELLKNKYHGEKLLIIGFAETATAISAYAAKEIGECFYIQTTRENMEECKDYFYFSEEHSHATEQKLCMNGLSEAVSNVDRIVFIDDEISTGKTILNIVNLMREKFISNETKITAASLINRMNEDDLKRFEQNNINVDFILKIPTKDYENEISGIKENESLIKDNRFSSQNNCSYLQLLYSTNPRRVCKMGDYIASVEDALNLALGEFKPKGKSVLVLGTEECMYPAICFGEKLGEKFPDVKIKTCSTTRSPILVSDIEDYPIKNCQILESFYEEGRTTFLYNVDFYDEVVVFTDSENISAIKNGVNSIKALFNECGEISVVRFVKEF